MSVGTQTHASEFTWTKSTTVKSGRYTSFYTGTAFVTDLQLYRRNIKLDKKTGDLHLPIPSKILSVIGKSETKDFYFHIANVDKEGDIMWWEYKSSTGIFKLLIYND